MATFKKIDPANMAETANLVHVFNISPESTEKKIVDFFQYCGDIIEYEIVEVENGYEALLLFDKASSVDTAVLLNNSRIDDRNIIVKKYDDAVKEAAASPETAAPAQTEAPQTGTSKLANFIADRMIQAEQISKSVDSKLGITEKFHLLVEESKKLDAKYGISEKTVATTAAATAAVKAKYNELKNNEKVNAAKTAAQPRVAAAKSAAQPTIDNIKHSSTVMKIQETYNQVIDKVSEVTQETLKIKKSKTLKLSPEGAAAVAAVSESNAPEGAAAAAEAKPVSTEEPVTEAAKN